jgi:hypothetical protein
MAGRQKPPGQVGATICLEPEGRLRGPRSAAQRIMLQARGAVRSLRDIFHRKGLAEDMGLFPSRRIVVHVVAGEDLGGALRREIDRLIGVAAGEDKRCDDDGNAEPRRHFSTHLSGPLGRCLADGQDKSSITRSFTRVAIH